MRLLHTTELTFREFIDDETIPKYAIISHRWSEDEVSYRDYVKSQKKTWTGERTGYGWLKIRKGAEIAREHGLQWFWIDTCCIDKRSSAELSEAINSMYRWYANSACCYVFLKDVDHGDFDNGTERAVHFVRHWYNDEAQYRDTESSAQCLAEQFESSVWFTRVWTLQELLAPEDLLFYNNEFQAIGSKLTMGDMIVRTTGINGNYLGEGGGRKSIQLAPMAERMKWASRRQATRKEDIAYSLLGIFDVNMPLLYGEGERAFSRLQSEVMKCSDDRSIFLWDHSGRNVRTAFMLMAPNVNCFANVRLPLMTIRGLQRLDYEETNKGLKVTVRFDRNELEHCLTAYGFAQSILPTGLCTRPVHVVHIPDEWIIRIGICRRLDNLDGGDYLRGRLGIYKPNHDLKPAIDCNLRPEAHHHPVLMGGRMNIRAETRTEGMRRTDGEPAFIYPRPHGTEYTIYFRGGFGSQGGFGSRGGFGWRNPIDETF